MEKKRQLPHTIEIKLQSIYHTLKSAERKAANYLREAPESLADESIVETAKKAGCSEATLVRFAKKLGYKGYLELKHACSCTRATGDRSRQSIYDTISACDSQSMVVEKVFHAAVQALEDTKRLMDAGQFLTGIQALKNCEKILVLGAGDAYIVGYSAYLKFSRIGLNVVCPADFDVQLLEASKLTNKDVVLLISHSGNTKTLYQAGQIAKEKGAFLIAITNYPLSPIAKLAEEVILTAAFIKNPHNETMAKRIPELCVIESMYISLLQENEKPYASYLNFANKSLEKNKIS